MFTLQDMLEQLVGEIHDEIDNQKRQMLEVNKGEFLVDGTEELGAVEEYLSVYLSGKPTDTVNHWILHHVERIPDSGELFKIDELEVLIEKASKRRIRQVRISCPTRLIASNEAGDPTKSKTETTAVLPKSDVSKQLEESET